MKALGAGEKDPAYDQVRAGLSAFRGVCVKNKDPVMCKAILDIVAGFVGLLDETRTVSARRDDQVEELGRIVLEIQGAMGEKLDRLEPILMAMGTSIAKRFDSMDARLAEDDGRKDMLLPVLIQHQNYIRIEFKSLCPCCGKVRILSEEGALMTAVACREHGRDRQLRDFEHTWLICNGCHGLKSTGKELDWVDAKFRGYHTTFKRWVVSKDNPERSPNMHLTLR